MIDTEGNRIYWIDFENEAIFKDDCEEINEQRHCRQCSLLSINEPIGIVGIGMICGGKVTHTYGIGGGYAGLCEAHYKALPSRDCLSEDYEEWRIT